MDILKQYEQKNTQEPRQTPQWEGSQKYGEVARFVIRLSGGRIQNDRQVNIVLVGIKAVAALATFIISFPIQDRSDVSKIYSPVAEPDGK